MSIMAFQSEKISSKRPMDSKPLLSLLTLKDYLISHPGVSLRQLKKHFAVEEEDLNPLLKRWEAKGYLHQKRLKPACGVTCYGCEAGRGGTSFSTYHWLLEKPERR